MIREMGNIFQRTGPKIAAIGIVFLFLFACGSERGSSTLSGNDNAVPIRLTAEVDRPVANPGDVITFTVEATYRPDVSLKLPEAAEKLSEFRIVNSSSSGPVQEDDYVVAKRWYKIQADIAGSYVIDPIEVTYHLPNGQQEAAKTPKIFIEIESMLAKEGEVEDIRDIKPPLTVSYLYRLIFLSSAVLCGLIVAVVLIRKLIDWVRRRARAQESRPRPAHEEALEALEMLLNKRLVEKGRMRKFCFEISMIFRKYMQARFGIPAVDLTAEEIFPRVEENGIIEEDLRPLVREFLMGTDLVKFGKYDPTVDEMEKILQHTRTFIERTTLAPADGAGGVQDGEKP